jgi:hypothetical protein
VMQVFCIVVKQASSVFCVCVCGRLAESYRTFNSGTSSNSTHIYACVDAYVCVSVCRVCVDVSVCVCVVCYVSDFLELSQSIEPTSSTYTNTTLQRQLLH